MAKAKKTKTKMKTHKGSKKVFLQRNSGSIKIGKPGTRHNTGKKSSKSNRKGRKANELHNSDYKRIKTLI